MNYADIKYCDVANGLGVRVSVFVSGCTHHCKNCFNEVAWDFNYGSPFTEEVIDKIIDFGIDNLLTIKGIKDDISNKETKKAIEYYINDYIKELEKRREDISKVTNLIVPKEVKYSKFIKYYETKQ